MAVKNKLAATSLKITKPGLYADGGGLFLQITIGKNQTPNRSWLVRYRAPNGKLREMGLGSTQFVTLAEARIKAEAARKKAANGIDPIAQRDDKRRQDREASIQLLTFKEAAETYRQSHESGWKNEKHRQQWASTLETYAYPVFGDVPVGAVNVGHVTKALDSIWKTKNETARRLRGRIENILDWAAVRGYRTGDNPARWRGHLEKAMPSVRRNRAHHPALPHARVASFIGDLKKVNGMGATALEFLILTGTRTNETIGARWEEFDLESATWTIPGERMKAGREHRVPLCEQAVRVLLPLREMNADGAYVFALTPGAEPISNMTLLMTLRRMGRVEITVHGFRSTFRDWAAEKTEFPREVAEAALAHTLQGVEAAYRRTDLFDKRRELMNAWGKYCFEVQMIAPVAADTNVDFALGSAEPKKDDSKRERIGRRSSKAA